MKVGFSFVLIFSCFTNSGAQDFLPGYYFTHDGKRVDGYVKHKYSASSKSDADNWIVFRKDQKGDKTELGIENVKAFVVGEDSFSIVKNFRINSFARYSQDFAQVLKKGKINLFLHYTTGGSGTTRFTAKTFLAQKNWSIYVLKNKDDIERLFAGDNEMSQRLSKKKYKFKDLESIVEEYNSLNSKK